MKLCLHYRPKYTEEYRKHIYLAGDAVSLLTKFGIIESLGEVRHFLLEREDKPEKGRWGGGGGGGLM